MLFLFALFLLAISVTALLWLTQYWLPRTAAFRESRNRVRIWFGQGEIVLWNPGQTFAFLRNKKMAQIGDSSGGLQSIYAFRNEEAIGPISLQTTLFTWNDDNVLTRDGQPLRMSIGVWWKVLDVEKYVFRIYSEDAAQKVQNVAYVPTSYPTLPDQVAHVQPKSGAARFDSVQLHRIADQWLRVLVESTVRHHLNQLAVADVVSSQAMEFLKMADLSLQSADEVKSHTVFEHAIEAALRDVQAKALDFGLGAEKMEVQHVYLPEKIQDAINETRIAFLAPIRSEREAEAARIHLEKLVTVLGRDNVALNQIMSNLKNANFLTPLPVFQPIADKLNAVVQKEATHALDNGNNGKVGASESTNS
jgi:regulator of protease activity HflC (stomatin/prohibitin superfamily)